MAAKEGREAGSGMHEPSDQSNPGSRLRMSLSSHCAPLVHAVIGLIQSWVWGLLLALAKDTIHAACPNLAGEPKCAEISWALWLSLQAMHSWLKLCEGDLLSDGCLAGSGDS